VKAVVHVTLKPEVLDPQGQAIARACATLGHAGVRSVRQGKVFEVEVDAPDDARARALVTELCAKLLVNPVIEDFCVVSIERSR